MALHQIRLPKNAAHLFRVVAFQKRLLKALSEPALDPNAVDISWIQSVWKTLDKEWVRKFCRGKEESVLIPLKEMASAPLPARQALFAEFCRQNRVKALLDAGGNFQKLDELPGFTDNHAKAVKKFFGRCYDLLGEDKAINWAGYAFPASRAARAVSRASYMEQFRREFPTSVLCPYCDGDIGTPQLDHYMAKSKFPLLSCSPWNLVPICPSCNEVATAKGNRLAITLGPPHSTRDWLHPFFRPASVDVKIKLTGSPKASIPQLFSPHSAEVLPLKNHTELVPSLSRRWTNIAAASYEKLVNDVRRRLSPLNRLDSLVQMALADHRANRGRYPFSLVNAAVCEAVLDYREEYIEEFTDPNPPRLV